jgi:exonuclease SbcD
MKILHTSDWHIGKKIGRYDRSEELASVLAEVAEIADSHAVDLVLVSGDIFDRAAPTVPSMTMAFDALKRLSNGGKRSVVAVAGNHDSGPLLEMFAPFLEPHNVWLVGEIKPPDEGGILDIPTPNGRAVVACFPFLREGRVVEFMDDTGDWYGQYAERVRRIAGAYDVAVQERLGEDGIGILMAHFMITGVSIRTGEGQRGERALHMGEAYAATSHSLAPGFHYVAMGHIHAPQAVPGSPVPAQYAGSLLQLDFGEAGEEKRVVIVDSEPGAPASVTSVPLQQGRKLVRFEGSWADIVSNDDLLDVYLELVLHIETPQPGLLEEVHDRFPYVVKVRLELPETEAPPSERAGKAWDELYVDYVEATTGAPPAEALLTAFRSVQEEAAG